MFDPDAHLRHAAKRRPYRAALLWALVLTKADEDGIYRPPSKASLRRDLATGDAETATASEVSTAIEHGIAQGMLCHESDESRLVLNGDNA